MTSLDHINPSSILPTGRSYMVMPVMHPRKGAVSFLARSGFLLTAITSISEGPVTTAHRSYSG